MRALNDEVAHAVAEGATLEETKTRVQLEEWERKLAGDDPIRQRSFRAYFVAPAVERAWTMKTEGDPLKKSERLQSR